MNKIFKKKIGFFKDGKDLHGYGRIVGNGENLIDKDKYNST